MGCDTNGPREGVGTRTSPAEAGLDTTGLEDTGRTGGRCLGVAIGTEADPHRVMRGHPAGTTFCLGPGVHRVVRPLAPQEGDTIAGLPGAVLNGSKVLTGWRQGDQRWTTSGHLPDEASLHGECLPEQPDCTFTEDVFLDGQRLSRAASADRVTADTYFADYSTNTITLGTDPGGRLVEQAVAPALVRSGHSGVTVRGLVVEKAANEAQEAAVDGRTDSPRTGSRWRVVGNVVQLNHGVGVGIGSRGVVRGNVIRAQGQLGISVWEQGALVRDNEVVLNGTAGYDPEWEAGGLKAWETVGVRLVGNEVHDNRGPGLWSDGGCHRTRYLRNRITGNWGAGIQHEISYDAVISRNRVVGNGLRHKGWAWEAGIQIQSSGGLGLIAVERNVVSGNPNGIMVLQSGDRRTEWPAPHGPHVVRNVLVRRNRVTLHGDQWTGLVHDTGGHGVFDRAVRFEGNTYRVDTSSAEHFTWRDEVLAFREWQSRAGQDRNGRLVVP
jgi:hypothetical protein